MKDLVKPDLLNGFVDFSRQLLETRDYDPHYFTLKELCELRCYNESLTYDFLTTFNGFYHFESADIFYKDQTTNPANMKYGKNRRGFMGNERVRDFLRGTQRVKREILEAREDGHRGWQKIYFLFSSVSGCGPWSAYYMTDLMKVILRKRITAPNFGNLVDLKAKRGPIAGISFLTGVPVERIAGNDYLQQSVYNEILRAGAPYAGMEEMESVLCGYMSLQKGTYYVGRDIDRQLMMIPEGDNDWWRARRKAFLPETLGELNDWKAVRKEKMGIFEKNKRWFGFERNDLENNLHCG